MNAVTAAAWLDRQTGGLTAMGPGAGPGPGQRNASSREGVLAGPGCPWPWRRVVGVAATVWASGSPLKPSGMSETSRDGLATAGTTQVPPVTSSLSLQNPPQKEKGSGEKWEGLFVERRVPRKAPGHRQAPQARARQGAAIRQWSRSVYLPTSSPSSRNVIGFFLLFCSFLFMLLFSLSSMKVRWAYIRLTRLTSVFLRPRDMHPTLQRRQDFFVYVDTHIHIHTLGLTHTHKHTHIHTCVLPANFFGGDAVQPTRGPTCVACVC